MIRLDTNLSMGSTMDIIDGVRAAERIGFDAAYSAETAHDPFLPLMIAAEHSSRIRLGTNIAVAFPRSPMILAHTARDLQRFSGGRFVLGLGTQVKGHNERRFSVPWSKPGPRLREVIESMRAIWDCWQNGTPLAYEGEHYNFSLMTPFFNPGPQEHHRVPIYIAGMNAYICRLAGELCDGFHVHPLNSVKFLKDELLPKLAEGAARSGRDASDVELCAPAFVITGEDEEETVACEGMVRQQIAFYGSTPAYRVVLATHGWEDLGPELSERARRGDWAGMAESVGDDVLEAFAVRAPRDKVGEALKAKYDGLVHRISLYLPFAPGRDDDWWQDLVATLHG